MMMTLLSKTGMLIILVAELIVLGIGVAIVIAIIQAINHTIKNNKKTEGDKNE